MLFRKKRETAIVFVDYEHWLISMKNLYGILPDVRSWAAEIRERHQVKDILFFANFNHPAMKNEVPRLREVSNSIIETQLREDNHPMKDMSDVVMIDALYRQAYDRHSPDTFILFTGDGHFQPVVRYLAQDCKKKVILYGVKNATSRMLREIAAEYHEVPDTENQVRMCYQLITDELDRLTRRYGEVITSFGSLVQRISEGHHISQQTVEIALRRMMDEGLVSKKKRYNKTRTATFDSIVPEWDRLIKAGLYTPRNDGPLERREKAGRKRQSEARPDERRVGSENMTWHKYKIKYDPEIQTPAVKASICTGEMTVGFVDKRTGKFHDLMLVRSQKELEDFKKSVGVTDLKTIY